MRTGHRRTGEAGFYRALAPVVKSEEEAADTGSLLTHFICLALSLLSMKQMERYCIITRVERGPSAVLPQGGASRYLPVFSPPLRSKASGRRGLHDA